MARYLQINKCSLADGPGVRVSVYMSGCRNHCPGCHNSKSWDFTSGTEFDEFTVAEILELLSSDYISGLTLCGGEPMEPENQEVLANLVWWAKEKYPTKTIWCYTGYEFEDLLKDGKKYGPYTDMLLNDIDVLVVGKFELDKRDITKENLWRGSTNQRVIDVQESLKQNKKIFLKNIPNNEADE